ncbi:hypothetical protein HDU76_010274 [Blyttiomyces sp. JEL0837]|nr:hypothetical protein HDU76_010274 [Blyttiomyces sp. JEL0837]
MNQNLGLSVTILNRAAPNIQQAIGAYARLGCNVVDLAQQSGQTMNRVKFCSNSGSSSAIQARR